MELSDCERMARACGTGEYRMTMILMRDHE